MGWFKRILAGKTSGSCIPESAKHPQLYQIKADGFANLTVDLWIAIDQGEFDCSPFLEECEVKGRIRPYISQAVNKYSDSLNISFLESFRRTIQNEREARLVVFWNSLPRKIEIADREIKQIFAWIYEVCEDEFEASENRRLIGR